MAEEEVEERPTPEALLEEARKEGRGKLKIFLGAYPGVGKTYSMLEAAHERRREGADVVVAIVETHGRKETERLLRGLEVLPRRELSYRGREFGEMDLDAVLARKPKIAIVDELAHTNVPGSRHAKRWEDVEEILAAGIDVYTTLNIQHLESLNDVVARISRVRVRETLPDKALELADEIELIDLPPDDLLQRLREGKVYVRDQVGRALGHFFSKGNLTAFRELAMRVAAERVDAQMMSFMRAHAIPGPWPTQDRLLVCVNESPVAKQLVRTAKRMADRARIPWIVLSVQTPRSETLPEDARDRIAEALRLAESLGAETTTLRAEADLAREILRFARERNVTRILVGRPRRRHWRAFFRENVAEQLVRKGEAFEVTIVSPAAEQGPGQRIEPGKPVKVRLDPVAYGAATAVVAAAAAVAFAVSEFLPLPNVSLVFMTAVLIVALRFGLWPSLFSSVLSFLAYNFLFTEPYYTLHVSQRGELLTIVFFFIVSVLVGNLAARLKAQVEAMRTTAARTDKLFEFSRKVVAAASLDDVLWASVSHVAQTLKCHALILLPKDGGLEIAAGFPPEDHLASRDWGAAEWAWEKETVAGWGSSTLPAAQWLFLPLKSKRGRVGLLGVSFTASSPQVGGLSLEQRRLLDALVDQVAVAVERAQISNDLEEARVTSETEQLRSALLSSVSHDLRTPLVSIIGSATTLAGEAGRLSEADRSQLVQTILEEGERLNRFVQNLLDMTRLGYGALELKKEWSDLREIVGRAARRLEKPLRFHFLEIDVPPQLDPVRADPVLIEQVVANLLDNAAKYAPQGSRITVTARRDGERMLVAVSDEGPGIPAEAREAVFDVFYRVRAGDRQVAGTGLGLAICRGLIEAHGGRILARDGPGGRGTTIEFSLPLEGDEPSLPVGASAEDKAETSGAETDKAETDEAAFERTGPADTGH
jgi:two-component system sensor histidine kinase KdpD